MYRHLCHLLAAFFCAAALYQAPAQSPALPPAPQSPRPTSLPDAPDAPAPQTEAAKKAQIHAQVDQEVKHEET